MSKPRNTRRGGAATKSYNVTTLQRYNVTWLRGLIELNGLNKLNMEFMRTHKKLAQAAETLMDSSTEYTERGKERT